MKKPVTLVLAGLRNELHALLSYLPKSRFADSKELSAYSTSVGGQKVVIIPLSYHGDVASHRTKLAVEKFRPHKTILVCSGAGFRRRSPVDSVVSGFGLLEESGENPVLKLTDGGFILLWDKSPEQGEAAAAKKLSGAKCFAHHASGPAQVLLTAGRRPLHLVVGISTYAGEGVISNSAYHHTLACGRAAKAALKMIDPSWVAPAVKCELCGVHSDPYEPRPA